ncbi:hypothetical protein E1287_07180 [Actinomadura sp. KC06]|uniref:hypothetical protein n=1 Tax=Actinomadura sp. KC06 TaxID=2530369 RepID=UPI001045098F|nr:hypothetical protein [Actinomadura sp. KC06]TDD37834.1 hypothetical protein E1287_07180 [Actinomadura sp. KC06]
MNLRLRVLFTAAGAAGVLALASGCAKMTEPFNDAPIKSKDDSAAEVYSMPDGFSNVATKCDRHGNRIYVVYHGDNPYGALNVVPQDPSCKRSTP